MSYQTCWLFENPEITPGHTVDPLLSSVAGVLLHSFFAICSASTLKFKLNQAQTQSRQTNKFHFSWVDFIFSFQVKRKSFFPPPNCLISDIQHTGVFTLSWAAHQTLWFLQVFASANPLMFSTFMCVRACASVQSFYKWLTLSKRVTCLCKKEAVSLAADIRLMSEFPFLFLIFPNVLYNQTMLPIQWTTHYLYWICFIFTRPRWSA